MTELNVTVRQREEASVVRLAGVIDESNQLSSIVDRVESRTAVINLGGVERINSRGVRAWIDWLATLDKRGVQPVLIACSPAIVAQLNLVKGFAGKAHVKSFYAPYRCTCGASQRLLVHLSEIAATDRMPPPCVCDACKSKMIFDGDAASYFAFLAHVEKAPILAHGSNAAVTPEIAAGPDLRVSQLHVQLRPSVVSFATHVERTSQREIAPPQPPRVERPYILVLAILLVLSLAVLAYLL